MPSTAESVGTPESVTSLEDESFQERPMEVKKCNIQENIDVTKQKQTKYHSELEEYVETNETSLKIFKLQV